MSDHHSHPHPHDHHRDHAHNPFPAHHDHVFWVKATPATKSGHGLSSR